MKHLIHSTCHVTCEVLVFVEGKPTFSFQYRRVGLSKRFLIFNKTKNPPPASHTHTHTQTHTLTHSNPRRRIDPVIDEMLLSGFKIISLCLSGHRPDEVCCVRLRFTSFESRFSALCKCNFQHNSTESTLRSEAKLYGVFF